jgi:uncharacterized protein (TIGR03118 family)
MFSILWRGSFARSSKLATRGSKQKYRSRRRLELECLEERALLSTSAFAVTNLVSDQAGVALIQDTDLVNAWGIALPPTGGNFWVAAAGTGKALVYSGDVNGSPFLKNELVVSIPGGAPTGQVFNGTGDFAVSSGGGGGPALFILSTEAGLITGWNPNAPPPPLSTVAQVGATTSGAVYKGVTIANNGSANFIYAANFSQHKIDVFDTTFDPATLSGTFNDPKVPDDYAPFNIQNLNGRLYVTYAKPDEEGEDDVPGHGHGFVAVFDTNGNLIKHLVSHGQLDSPWGLAIAPSNFGKFAGDLLVGNFGDGRIHAYDADKGKYVGVLKGQNHKPIQIDGLWGLALGNGVSAGDSNALYFSAGPDDEAHGLFGKVTVVSANKAHGHSNTMH